MNFLFNDHKIAKVHFIGIGGISMSGLSEILLNLGYNITGSDMKYSEITTKLIKKGITVFEGHSEQNIKDPDMVVYTAAISSDNPELIKARTLNIPVIERSVLLGEIMKMYDCSIAISGTHGKTTTTSMVSAIMVEANLDPTIHIGGNLNIIGGNTKIGNNKYFITEACEYVESFLKFNPSIAVILNIEEDHLDYFKDLEQIKESFYKFASLLPKDGHLVACADDKNTMEIANKISRNLITFGADSDSTWNAKNIMFRPNGYASFDLFKNNQKIDNIILNVPGIHNVKNALAAISVADIVGCSIEAIKNGLAKFNGTERRFQIKGEFNHIRVIDDYAHHPSEIKATLAALKRCGYKKIWCVFQPHTYTRTKCLLNEFSAAFKDADNVIVTDIYAAREVDTGEINSIVLAQKVNLVENNKAKYVSDFQEIVEYLKENVSKDEVIITMGAGDIYKVGELFLNT